MPEPHYRAAKFYYEHLLGNTHTPGLMQNHEGELREFGGFRQLVLKPKSKFHRAAITQTDEEDHKRMLEEAKGLAENEGITGWDYHTVYDKKEKSWWITFGPEEVIRKWKEEDERVLHDNGIRKHEETTGLGEEELPKVKEVRRKIIEDAPEEKVTAAQVAEDALSKLHGLIPTYYKTEVEHGKDGVSRLKISPKWWVKTRLLGFLFSDKYSQEEHQRMIQEKVDEAKTKSDGLKTHMEYDEKSGWIVSVGEEEKIRELARKAEARRPRAAWNAETQAEKPLHQTLAEYYHRKLELLYGKKVKSIDHFPSEGRSEIKLKLGRLNDDDKRNVAIILRNIDAQYGLHGIKVTPNYDTKAKEVTIKFLHPTGF